MARNHEEGIHEYVGVSVRVIVKPANGDDGSSARTQGSCVGCKFGVVEGMRVGNFALKSLFGIVRWCHEQ